ncbi:MAG TPA: hypothetical protein VFQ39_13050 [Longimicrobium sp.]|nr:hypothetical protein [Longimicrobium sp.]
MTRLVRRVLQPLGWECECAFHADHLGAASRRANLLVAEALDPRLAEVWEVIAEGAAEFRTILLTDPAHGSYSRVHERTDVRFLARPFEVEALRRLVSGVAGEARLHAMAGG